MGCWGGTSIWAKLALVAVLIALLLDIIGVATISWMVYQIATNSVRVGLFRMKSCANYACTESDVGESMKTGAFSATQAFELLALCLLVIGAIVVVVYCVVDAARTKITAIAAIALCCTASLFGFIGMICWASYVSDPYIVSYSLGLTVLAAILACIAGMLLVPDVLDRYGSRAPRQQYPVRGTQVGPPNKRFLL